MMMRSRPKARKEKEAHRKGHPRAKERKARQKVKKSQRLEHKKEEERWPRTAKEMTKQHLQECQVTNMAWHCRCTSRHGAQDSIQGSPAPLWRTLDGW